MARQGFGHRDIGERFPAIAVSTVAHGTLLLPDYFGDDWGIVLAYRAHW